MEIRGWGAELGTGARDASAYRGRAMSNLTRMGHCAPAVAQTIHDLTRPDAAWVVKAAAGLPGGIGNTRQECGGVTAAVLMLGLRYGDRAAGSGLPVVLERGDAYCERFTACHGSLLCSAILGERRLPVPCARVVGRAPGLLAEVVSAGTVPAPGVERAEAHRRLLAHLAGRGFHCAHAVLRALGLADDPALLAATYGFVGGTLLKGLTCSALTAGVIALGLRAGEIETRRARVVRMLVTMAVGGDALADGLNRFNPSMNRGHALAAWFAREHGSTSCRDVTRCELSTPAGVARYVEGGQVERCEELAVRVAEQVTRLLREAAH